MEGGKGDGGKGEAYWDDSMENMFSSSSAMMEGSSSVSLFISTPKTNQPDQ